MLSAPREDVVACYLREAISAADMVSAALTARI